MCISFVFVVFLEPDLLSSISFFFSINSHLSLLKPERSISFCSFYWYYCFSNSLLFLIVMSSLKVKLSTFSSSSICPSSFFSGGSGFKSSFMVPQLALPAPPFLISFPLPVPLCLSRGCGSPDTFLSFFISWGCL